MRRVPITELRGVACHMGSHSVTRHPTASKLVPDLPTPEGWKAELT